MENFKLLLLDFDGALFWSNVDFFEQKFYHKKLIDAFNKEGNEIDICNEAKIFLSLSSMPYQVSM